MCDLFDIDIRGHDDFSLLRNCKDLFKPQLPPDVLLDLGCVNTLLKLKGVLLLVDHDLCLAFDLVFDDFGNRLAKGSCGHGSSPVQGLDLGVGVLGYLRLPVDLGHPVVYGLGLASSTLHNCTLSNGTLPNGTLTDGRVAYGAGAIAGVAMAKSSSYGGGPLPSASTGICQEAFSKRALALMELSVLVTATGVIGCRSELVVICNMQLATSN